MSQRDWKEDVAAAAAGLRAAIDSGDPARITERIEWLGKLRNYARASENLKKVQTQHPIYYRSAPLYLFDADELCKIIYEAALRDHTGPSGSGLYFVVLDLPVVS